MSEKKQRRFSHFIAEEWQRLVTYVHAWIEDTAEADAEDIVQEVITSIYEKADVTTPIGDLGAYVYRALRNRIVDRYRAKKRTVSLDADGLPPMGGSLLDVLADLRYEASAEAEKAELRDGLFAAIDALPQEQRAVVVATELEGRKFRELSEDWEVPIGTLLARKHRAIRSLRSALVKTSGNQGGIS